jgi:hypothetical protein
VAARSGADGDIVRMLVSPGPWEGGRSFDAVFCDGDHSYWWTKRDFLNLGRYAGIFCLHDIKAHEYDQLEGGVTRFWAEFKESFRNRCSMIEISHSGPDWMGIGVAFMNKPF